MFNNISSKIKTVAKAYFWVSVILGELTLLDITFALSPTEASFWTGFAMVIYPFAQLAIAYLLYGLGELIEKVTLIAEQRDVTGTAPSAVASVAPVTATKEESAVKESVSTEAPVKTERILSEEEREKREQALKKFFEQGLISEEEYRKALGKGV